MELNFTEYEQLPGPFALPYLVKRYGCPSLVETLAQVNAQCDRMPDAAKGLCTTTVSGEFVLLVTHDEYDRRLANAIAEIDPRSSD